MNRDALIYEIATAMKYVEFILLDEAGEHELIVPGDLLEHAAADLLIELEAQGLKVVKA